MSEKGTSEGTIYFNNQRKRWNAQFNEYDPVTGKMHRKTRTFKTEDEAKKYLKTIMYQKENVLFIEHNGIPVCELMKSTLKLKYDTNQITGTQYARVLRTIEKIETIPIGHKNIDEVTSDELQTYMNSVKHLSNSSIDKIYQQFNQVFRVAINKGYTMKNPMINVIKPRSLKEDKIVRAFTFDEQQKFTDWLLNKKVSECKYKNVFLIQLFMGLRVGETLALTTHDIDLHNKRMRVHRTLTTDENNSVIMGNKTKTYAGKRVLPIPDYLYPHIVEQMKIAEQQENNEEKLLFKPDNSKYSRRTNVNSELQRILEKYFNITDISTHSLRHSFGTRCIESGMAPVVVQRLMGHNSVQVTLDTYTSVYDKFKESELDKVNQYYLNENLIPSQENQLNTVNRDDEHEEK